MPIPNATAEQQEHVASRVDRILAAKKRNPSADTSALEREIDKLVYQLYGLTDEEIAVVEGTDGGGRGVGDGEGTVVTQGGGRDKARPSQERPFQKKKRKPKFEEEF